MQVKLEDLITYKGVVSSNRVKASAWLVTNKRSRGSLKQLPLLVYSSSLLSARCSTHDYLQLDADIVKSKCVFTPVADILIDNYKKLRGKVPADSILLTPYLKGTSIYVFYTLELHSDLISADIKTYYVYAMDKSLAEYLIWMYFRIKGFNIKSPNLRTSASSFNRIDNSIKPLETSVYGLRNRFYSRLEIVKTIDKASVTRKLRSQNIIETIGVVDKT